MLGPVTFSRFPGLRLDVNPTELGFEGALDLNNIDYHQIDRPVTRGGTKYFLPSPITSEYYGHILTYEPSNSPAWVFASRESGANTVWEAYTDNVLTDTSASVGTNLPEYGRIVAYGANTGDAQFFATGINAGAVMERFTIDGSNLWDTPTYTAEQPEGSCVGVTPWDNRLVNGGGQGTGYESLLRFSDEGNPLNFPTDNELLLHPDDGEYIADIVTWGNRMFVFKQTKFYVFWGTSVDSSGGPVFEYDVVYGEGVEVGARRVTVMRDGVYFANKHGVFRTQGGPSQLISQAIQPLFDLNESGVFEQFNPYLNISGVSGLGIDGGISCVGTDGDELLLVGGQGDRVIVHNTREGWWSLWDLPGLVAVGPASIAPYQRGFLYTTAGSGAEGDIVQYERGSFLEALTGEGLDARADEAWGLIATGGTAGNFRLTFNGQQTADIAYNATASAVQTALLNLSNIDSGEVVCNRGPLPNSQVSIVFLGDLAEASHTFTVSNENVTNGNAALTELRNGDAGDTVAASWTSGGLDLGTDEEKVVRSAVVTASDCEIGLAVSGDFAAFDTPFVHDFSDLQQKQYRSNVVNVSGHIFCVKMTNDNEDEAASRFNPHRLTLNVRPRRGTGLDTNTT